MKLNKFAALCMIGVLFVTLLTSCNEKSSVMADNEVVSMIPYDTAKDSLIIDANDNLDWDKLKGQLEEKFPDVNIILRHGMNSESKVLGDTADIYMIGEPPLSPELEKNLMDLSALESTDNYYATALENCASINDDKQYLLPMPCNIRGIIYNKTMFEENGWEVPKSKSEFIKLCHTIENSKVVERAFQPTLTYAGDVLIFGEYFQMANMFDSLEYYSWAEKYGENGEGSAEFFLPTLVDTFQEFLDENIIKTTDFSVNPAARSSMMYRERTAAMTIETQNASIYAADAGSEDEFAMMPFFSGDEEGSDYVLASPVTYIAVNKKVSDKGNEEKLKLVTEFLNYIATYEGQEIFVGEGKTAITQLKNAVMKNKEGVMLENVLAAINSGRMVPAKTFFNAGINLSRTACDDVITGMLHVERQNKNIINKNRPVTFKEAVAYLDNINKDVINNAEAKVETVYATAKEAFTVLETTEYLAEMLKNKSGADIGLYLCNTLCRGNNMAIYQGKLFKKIGGLYPYDFLASMDTTIRGEQIDEDDNKLLTVKMTGEQIMQALEYPENCIESKLFEPFFVASGLNIEFSPWAPKGSRYLSIALSDGSPLELEKVYTVAIWNHTVAEKYITKKLKVYDDTFYELLKEQLTKDGTITPFNDNRFVLNWD